MRALRGGGVVMVGSVCLPACLSLSLAQPHPPPPPLSPFSAPNRRDLKIRIKALLEHRWSQQEGDDENDVVRWNARNISAFIDNWKWTMQTAEKIPLCEISIQKFRWVINEENKATQAGTTEYEIQDMEIGDISPPDVAGGKGSIAAVGGVRPPILSR